MTMNVDDADVMTAAAEVVSGVLSLAVSNGTCRAANTASQFVWASELLAFNNWYKHYHGYLAAIVCLLGSIANVFNIVVLSQRNMFSATNCILTGLAISDGLTMIAYLPFALRFYVLYGTEPTHERNSLPAVRFLLFYACFSVVVHTVSIWLTVTLATFRYILIKHPRQAAQLCTLERAKMTVLLVYVVSLIVCIPNFATINVQGDEQMKCPGQQQLQEPPTGNRSMATNAVIWVVRFKQSTQTERFLYSFNFWIQALLVKLLPCVGLTFLSVLLVRTMRRADARRQTLRLSSSRSNSEGSQRGSCNREAPRIRLTNRTTRMLLVVVILFLVTEFPQGVIAMLSGICHNFVEEVYLNVGDLIDIMALTNNGINFILYCTMSKQFRDSFIHVFNFSKTKSGSHRMMLMRRAHVRNIL